MRTQGLGRGASGGVIGACVRFVRQRVKGGGNVGGFGTPLLENFLFTWAAGVRIARLMVAPTLSAIRIVAELDWGPLEHFGVEACGALAGSSTRMARLPR